MNTIKATPFPIYTRLRLTVSNKWQNNPKSIKSQDPNSRQSHSTLFETHWQNPFPEIILIQNPFSCPRTLTPLPWGTIAIYVIEPFSRTCFSFLVNWEILVFSFWVCFVWLPRKCKTRRRIFNWPFCGMTLSRGIVMFLTVN